MEITPTETEFYVLPLIKVVKHKNPLTEESKEIFDYKWDKFYTIEFGWFKWIWIYQTEVK